jgi:hypothetical protein
LIQDIFAQSLRNYISSSFRYAHYTCFDIEWAAHVHMSPSAAVAPDVNSVPFRIRPPPGSQSLHHFFIFVYMTSVYLSYSLETPAIKRNHLMRIIISIQRTGCQICGPKDPNVVLARTSTWFVDPFACLAVLLCIVPLFEYCLMVMHRIYWNVVRACTTPA